MPSPVTLLDVPALSSVAEYAYAATAPAGTRLVFLAGSCPLDADGNTRAPGDYAGQAAACLDSLRTALAAVGASMDNLISTRVLVASSAQADLVEAWQVVRDGLDGHRPPSTLLGVAALGYDNQLVEIEAVAAVQDDAPA